MKDSFDPNESGIFGTPFKDFALVPSPIVYDEPIYLDAQRLDNFIRISSDEALYIKTELGNIYKICIIEGESSLLMRASSGEQRYLNTSDLSKIIGVGFKFSFEGFTDDSKIISFQHANNLKGTKIETEFSILRNESDFSKATFSNVDSCRIIDFAIGGHIALLGGHVELYFRTESGNIYRIGRDRDRDSTMACFNANEGTAHYLHFRDRKELLRKSITVGSKVEIAGFRTTKVTEIYLNTSGKGQIVADFAKRIEDAQKVAVNPYPPSQCSIIFKNMASHSRGYLFSKLGQTFKWDLCQSSYFTVDYPNCKTRRGECIILETEYNNHYLIRCDERNDSYVFTVNDKNGQTIGVFERSEGDQVNFTVGKNFKEDDIDLGRIEKVVAAEAKFYNREMGHYVPFLDDSSEGVVYYAQFLPSLAVSTQSSKQNTGFIRTKLAGFFRLLADFISD